LGAAAMGLLLLAVRRVKEAGFLRELVFLLLWFAGGLLLYYIAVLDRGAFNIRYSAMVTPALIALLGGAAAGWNLHRRAPLGWLFVLLLAPGSLAGDPVRGPVLALTHLVTLGWIGSLLFAAAYLVGPMLAEHALWSGKLAAAHLALHLVGLTLLLGGLTLLRYDIASFGAGTVVAGIALMILNLMVTGSHETRWNPANIAFQSAMFWLATTGALALLMLRGRLATPWLAAPETLIALHAHFALFGFLTQALLAVSLRVVPMSLGQNQHPRSLDTLAWTAWAVLNGGLMLLVPASLVGASGFIVAIGGVIAVGVTLFAADIACILWMFRARVSWGAATHGTGIALLVAIVAAALWRLPEVAAGTLEQTREWMRFYISLALLGPFSFAVVGTAGRLLPRLVWSLRFAPWAGHGRMPAPATLGREAAVAPAYFCLLMAWVYLALGQWHANQHALRFGAVLMLLAGVWSLVSVAPAIVRLVLGVTPADLGAEPRAAARAAATRR
ncbi:MAG: hypothetical protein IAE82_05865, partial [Opitutaceae bacterium]|nr:hypothetical protein [Opitutaceae bacterium]